MGQQYYTDRHSRSTCYYCYYYGSNAMMDGVTQEIFVFGNIVNDSAVECRLCSRQPSVFFFLQSFVFALPFEQDFQWNESQHLTALWLWAVITQQHRFKPWLYGIRRFLTVCFLCLQEVWGARPSWTLWTLCTSWRCMMSSKLPLSGWRKILILTW